jgi:hypothetical protein
MGMEAGEIRKEFHTRLSQMARELSRELYPQGLPRGTKFSELEAVAGALGDEMARQLIEINVQEQADDWPEEELGECPVCGGGGPQGPRSTPRAHDHTGRRRLEATRRELSRLSAGFFPLRIKRRVLTIPASAHACSRRSSTPVSTVFRISRRRVIWPNCPT